MVSWVGSVVMIVAARMNGQNGFGIRVGRARASRHFSRNRQTVCVEIDGALRSFRLTETFWTTCPEFRGKAIGEWLRRNGLVPWPRGRPPRVVLEELGENRFRLSLRRSDQLWLF